MALFQSRKSPPRSVHGSGKMSEYKDGDVAPLSKHTSPHNNLFALSSSTDSSGRPFTDIDSFSHIFAQTPQQWMTAARIRAVPRSALTHARLKRGPRRSTPGARKQKRPQMTCMLPTLVSRIAILPPMAGHDSPCPSLSISSTRHLLTTDPSNDRRKGRRQEW
jgi:hypothetical protein